jgi:hypothetical protein
MAGNPLRVVIFTSVPPRQVARILARIRRDASEVHVVGVLYERRPPKTLQQRMGIWRKKCGAAQRLQQPLFAGRHGSCSSSLWSIPCRSHSVTGGIGATGIIP